MRLLVAIANYGFKNTDYLTRLIREYKSMPCDVDIVVLSNVPKRLDPDIEVVVGLPAKDPWSLPFGHQRIFANRLQDYDLFIYSEDDMLITWRNIEAFLSLTKVLPEDRIAGFVRYELDSAGERSYPEFHGPFHWIANSVTKIDKYTFAIFSNLHSGCYITAQDQLKRAIASGGYLVKPHQGRYDLLCSAATDPYTQCGFTKLICISHISDCLVHHLPNRYANRDVFGIGEDEFNKQIALLLSMGDDRTQRQALFPTEKKIDHVRWDKTFYSTPDEALLSLVPKDAENILSIGCGDATTEAVLAGAGVTVTAIPLDPIMGMLAASKGVRVTAPDFDTAFEELDGAKFDCIIFSDVLQHLSEPTDILSKAVKLLSNRGELLISIPNFDNLKVFKDHFPYPVLKKWTYGKHLLRMIKKRLLRKWLRSVGIKQRKAQYVSWNQRLSPPILPLRIFNILLSERIMIVAKR